MKQNKTTAKLFDEVSEFISESRALLTQGAFMELKGMDEQVRLLCEQVLLLTDEERAPYSEKLTQMLDDLKQLGDDLAQQRDVVFGEINHLSQHHKASAAYQQTSTFGKKKTQDKE